MMMMMMMPVVSVMSVMLRPVQAAERVPSHTHPHGHLLVPVQQVLPRVHPGIQRIQPSDEARVLEVHIMGHPTLFESRVLRQRPLIAGQQVLHIANRRHRRRRLRRLLLPVVAVMMVMAMVVVVVSMVVVPA